MAEVSLGTSLGTFHLRALESSACLLFRQMKKLNSQCKPVLLNRFFYNFPLGPFDFFLSTANLFCHDCGSSFSLKEGSATRSYGDWPFLCEGVSFNKTDRLAFTGRYVRSSVLSHVIGSHLLPVVDRNLFCLSLGSSGFFI